MSQLSRVRSGASPWVMVVLLTLLQTAAFIDRQVLNLLVDPLKHHLQVDEVRMSLIQGTAFAVSYAVMSPILGRISDRANRRNLLIGALIFWSLCTMACGVAPGYWWLFAARVGVGGAEACVTPAVWSLLADTFDRKRLPRAMSVFLLGPYLGGGLALIFGGMLIGAASWMLEHVPLLHGLLPFQLVFVVVGIPGIVLAMLLFVVREPERIADAHAPAASSLAEVSRFFWEHRAFFGRFLLGASLVVTVLYAIPTWMPVVLSRGFGVSLPQVGMQYGPVVLVAGSIGALSGPWIDQLVARHVGAASPLVVVTIAACALAVAVAVLPFVPSYTAALALTALITFLYSMPVAMAATALQLATPSSMRGIASAAYVFLCSVVGLGIAPVLVAFLTEHVFHAPAMVASSLAIVCTISAALGGWLIWRSRAAYLVLSGAARPVPLDQALAVEPV